ncbi:MAG TPA: hypothetical protein VFT55_05045 [Planctomycetota bacterium]|nr:hypothetical protein [Planctomycetota bacterium]
MTDQVQHLIDRIRRDAVEVGQTDAARIQQQAKDEAKRTVEQAQARAAAIVAEAEQKANALVDRGGVALEQAARDLLIAIGQRLQAMIDALLASTAQETLRPEVVEQMLLRLCEVLAQSGFDEKSMTIAVSPGERDRVVAFALGKLRETLKQGAQVHVDQQLRQGFRISFGNDSVRHDFTPASIAALLSQFVRPQLGEVVQRAALGISAGKP